MCKQQDENLEKLAEKVGELAKWQIQEATLEQILKMMREAIKILGEIQGHWSKLVKKPTSICDCILVMSCYGFEIEGVKVTKGQ